ncbi:hypothetical protein C2E23DRAFT_859599 [Lenzites betulinus]|nr:hypothetical protein C2E23DRAFT_859599 [Lenzites betulinus]
MAGKTLSNGTMALRFMQNAQRAKLQAQVELEQAKIKDDAEWSVSQDVRDAWGIGQNSSSTSSDNVVYEASYVPFLFQSDAVEASSSSQVEERPKLKGRRTFNAKGKEVVEEEKLPEDGKPPATENTDEKPPGARFDQRPTSISGFRVPVSMTRDGKKPRTKTAQQLIHETGVRPPASMQPPPPPPIKQEEGFLKPAGVDEPVRTARKAPSAVPRVKRERDRDDGTDHLGLEGKKRKKKKKDASA